MTTQTAPSKDEISALTGSDLTDAIADACIDWKEGGSRSDGSLTADEARAALTRHYYPGDEPADGAPDEPADDTDELEDRELTVEELRDQQLAAGETTGALKDEANRRSKMTAAEQRAGVAGARPNEGRVDNMTRRDDADVLQGHFCVIDFSDETDGAQAKAAVEAMIGEGNARTGSGDYGVYVEPGVLDETGYPLTATVLLRDEHSCLVSSVPYRALRPALAGGRR